MINKKLRVKGVLFDLDGTLVDSKPAYFAAARLAFSELGLKPLSKEEAIEIPKRLEKNMPLYINDEKWSYTFLKVYLNSYYSIS